MAVQLKRRRDTAANVAAFTGAQGELIVDLTNNRITLHDGVTPGGWPVAKLAEIVSATRSTVADVSYNVLITDRTIAYTALTAARTVVLPAASAFPSGVDLRVVDESGNASATTSITLTPSNSDLVNGATAAAITSAYGSLVLQSNGASSPNGKWTIVERSASNLPAVGIATSADASNPLSVYGASALFNGANFNITVNKSTAANTASVLFQDGFSGRAQIGLTGDDNLHVKVSANGSTWTEALVINAATGQPTFPQGIAAGAPVGFRNRLRNASFAINQRAVSGTVTLAAGAYGHDGARAGSGGATYTFATTGIDTTLTVTAGSLILPIEAALIEGGAYMLSNAGTAQARVWQGTGYVGSGSYANAPLVSSGLVAATQTNVEFAMGTILRPQFEPGSVATAFERRPPGVELALCQRYYEQSYLSGVAPGTAGASGYETAMTDATLGVLVGALRFKASKRASPTVKLYSFNSGAANAVYYTGSGADVGVAATYSIGSEGFTNIGLSSTVGALLRCYFHWTASAEV